MIIDCHTHLANPAALPDIFYDGWVENVRRALPPGFPERHQKRIVDRVRTGAIDPDGSLHVKEMDEAGIDISVSLIIDFGIAFEGLVPPIEEVYQMHRELAERNPGRFLIFAGIDPRRGNAGLELFERSLRDWGFKGLKLYPPCGYSPSDESLFPYYDLCAQYKVPVLTHTGPTTPNLSFKYTEPMATDDAAFKFPGVNFILGHAATTHRETAGLLAQFRPNVYLDMSGFQSELGRGRWHETLAWHKEHGHLRKLLFGTDWPIHRPMGSQKDWTASLKAAVEEGPLTADECKWIHDDNPREIFGL